MLSTMKTVNLINLNTDVPVYEQNGEFYFDLLTLAELMGYSQPKKAIKDFIQRRKIDTEKWAICPDGNKVAPESDLYRFLMNSNAPKGREWQDYVCDEILPRVRKVGLKAIKELEAHQLIQTHSQSPELFDKVAEILGEDPTQFCLDNMYYRVLGYMPPSEAKDSRSLSNFWFSVDLEKSDCIHIPKWVNAYREDQKWYAFKEVVYKPDPVLSQEEIDEILPPPFPTEIKDATDL